MNNDRATRTDRASLLNDDGLPTMAASSELPGETIDPYARRQEIRDGTVEIVSRQRAAPGAAAARRPICVLACVGSRAPPWSGGREGAGCAAGDRFRPRAGRRLEVFRNRGAL